MNSPVFKWLGCSYGPNHLKSRPFKTRTFFVQISNVFWQNGGHLYSVYGFNISKSGSVQISDTHCIYSWMNEHILFVWPWLVVWWDMKMHKSLRHAGWTRAVAEWVCRSSSSLVRKLVTCVSRVFWKGRLINWFRDWELKKIYGWKTITETIQFPGFLRSCFGFRRITNFLLRMKI